MRLRFVHQEVRIGVLKGLPTQSGAEGERREVAGPCDLDVETRCRLADALRAERRVDRPREGDERIPRKGRSGERECRGQLRSALGLGDAHELEELQQVELHGVARRQHRDIGLPDRHLGRAHIQGGSGSNLEFGLGQVQLSDHGHPQRVLERGTRLIFQDGDVGLRDLCPQLFARIIDVGAGRVAINPLISGVEPVGLAQGVVDPEEIRGLHGVGAARQGNAVEELRAPCWNPELKEMLDVGRSAPLADLTAASAVRSPFWVCRKLGLFWRAMVIAWSIVSVVPTTGLWAVTMRVATQSSATKFTERM